MNTNPFTTSKEVRQYNSEIESEYTTAIISGYRGHYTIAFNDSNFAGLVPLCLSKQSRKDRVFKSLDTAVAYAYSLGCSFVKIHAYEVPSKTITGEDVIHNFLTLLD